MYFSKLDQITYNPVGTGQGKDVTNIMNSVLVKYHPATNTTLYLYHTVKDGETPEGLAYDFYKNSYYHWIILMMNDMVDPFFDWPLDTNRLNAMLTMRYGAGNEDVTHKLTPVIPSLGFAVPLLYNLTTEKYLDELEAIVAKEYFDANSDTWPVNVSPVSNREFEQNLNDIRREVKILRFKYVQDFVTQFEDLMARDTLV